MPHTGVYFIPSNPNASTALGAITERLRSAFPDEDPIPTNRWALEQKLMRDTPSLLPQPTGAGQRPPKPRYMQFLSLTHHPTHGFIYTSEPPERPFHPPHPASPAPSATSPAGNSPPAATPASTGSSLAQGQSGQASAADALPMIMTTLPPVSFGSLFQHFVYACQPFWCHRLTVTVPNGVTYDLADFRVRLGDVRQTFPTARVRGTLVEIEWRGPSVIETFAASVMQGGSSPSANVEGSEGGNAGVELDADSGVDMSFSVVEEEDIDAEFAATAALIRDFWGRIGVDGAREAILVPGIGKEIKERLRRLRDGKERQNAVEHVGEENELLAQLGGVSGEEDLDPQAGMDVARQYMEVLRFNR